MRGLLSSSPSRTGYSVVKECGKSQAARRKALLEVLDQHAWPDLIGLLSFLRRCPAKRYVARPARTGRRGGTAANESPISLAAQSGTATAAHCWKRFCESSRPPSRGRAPLLRIDALH